MHLGWTGLYRQLTTRMSYQTTEAGGDGAAVLQGIKVHVMSGDAPSVVERYASLAGIPLQQW